MKRMVILLYVFLLIVSLPGCKSPSEIATEKIAEEISEELVGGDVDIDGEQVTITADGTTTTLGGTEWPAGDLGNQIPEFTKGVITYVAETETEFMIQFEEVKQGDFEAYLETIIAEGFTENTISSTYDGGTFYTADNGQGIIMNLACDCEANQVMITVSKQE